MMFPLVSQLADGGLPVGLVCGTLGFSRQAYYAWRAAPVSDRDWHDAHLVNALLDAHHDDPEFGYRFLADEVRDAGFATCENRVHRLCRLHGITSTTVRRRRGKSSRPGPPVADDLVRRQFDVDVPDRVWLADITEHRTA